MRNETQMKKKKSNELAIEFPFRHHAFCLQGDGEALKSDLLQFLERQAGVVVKKNPDIYIVETESLTVEECRNIKSRQNQKPLHGNEKYFLISFNRITGEAANSLLKVLEEPTPGTRFFLIVPSRKILPQTVESRLSFINNPNSAVSGGGEENVAAAFLKAAATKRLATTKKLAEEISADKKSNADASAFVRSLEKEIHRHSKDLSEKSYASAITEVLTTERYLGGRSPSVKILLDNLALVLPKLL